VYATLWLFLILAVTVGNLVLGFALACLLGHGPTWATRWLISLELAGTYLRDLPAIIRFRKSPQSPP
jgi:hypothetical protein